MWNVDPTDWKPGTTAEEIAAHVVGRVKPGSIVVLHDTKEATVRALPAILHGLGEQGYQFVTVDDLFYLQEEAKEHEPIPRCHPPRRGSAPCGRGPGRGRRGEPDRVRPKETEPRSPARPLEPPRSLRFPPRREPEERPRHKPRTMKTKPYGALGLLATLGLLGGTLHAAPRSHVIGPKDTLYSIAKRYGTTVPAIARRNGISNVDLILDGAVLQIPEGRPARYTVKAADTASGIAHRFGLGLAELLAANPQITDPNLIMVGQVITLPGGGGQGRYPAPAPVQIAPAPVAPLPPAAPQPYLPPITRPEVPEAQGAEEEKEVEAPTPIPGFYTVVGGETLQTIAAHFHLVVADLRNVNPKLSGFPADQPLPAGLRVILPPYQPLVPKGS